MISSGKLQPTISTNNNFYTVSIYFYRMYFYNFKPTHSATFYEVVHSYIKDENPDKREWEQVSIFWLSLEKENDREMCNHLDQAPFNSRLLCIH